MELINKNVARDIVYTGIQDYHSHQGHGYNMPISNDKPYMIGVELETVFPSTDERNRWCRDFKSNWIFMETDGSLPRQGCEFISTPLAPKDAKNAEVWLKLIKVLREAKVRSYGSSSTGLHVHISRTVFGTDAQVQSDCIGRLIYFYYYVLSASVRAKIFGRQGNSYAQELERNRAKKTSAAGVLKVALKYKEVREQISKELCDATRPNRYYSINVQNPDTIEFRQGKGSVNNRRLAAICEFVEASCLYVKKYTDISKYSEQKFIESLKEDGPCKLYYFTDEM